jgi:hypothetical protein
LSVVVKKGINHTVKKKKKKNYLYLNTAVTAVLRMYLHRCPFGRWPGRVVGTRSRSILMDTVRTDT